MMADVTRRVLSWPEPDDHTDAVVASAESFESGAAWMFDRMCRFLDSEMHDMKLFSPTNGPHMEDEMKEQRIVMVNDPSVRMFLERLRQAMFEVK